MTDYDLSGYMTTEAASKQLGFHVEHIRRMMRQGVLKGKKQGGIWLVSVRAVIEYQEQIDGTKKHDPTRRGQGD